MLRRLPIAALAALIFVASGPAAILGSASPAAADQDDHRNHPTVHRGPNPYGANGYWKNGAWHYAASHPKHPKHQKHHGDRDDR